MIEKVVFLGIKEFHGLHDDIKIMSKKLTPVRYRLPNFVQTKKRDQWLKP